MKRLEEIVDQPLFQRTGRGVVLTNPGERLLAHAQRILRLHDEAMADLSGKGLSGTIRFGCPDDYAAVFLPPLLRQFSSQHPQALVEVICAPTPRLLEQLEMHALDLAMISLPDDTTNANIIRREPLVWVGSAGMDSAHFDPLPLALSDPDTLDHVAACEALRRVGSPLAFEQRVCGAYSRDVAVALNSLLRNFIDPAPRAALMLTATVQQNEVTE